MITANPNEPEIFVGPTQYCLQMNLHTYLINSVILKRQLIGVYFFCKKGK